MWYVSCLSAPPSVFYKVYKGKWQNDIMNCAQLQKILKDKLFRDILLDVTVSDNGWKRKKEKENNGINFFWSVSACFLLLTSRVWPYSVLHLPEISTIIKWKSNE